MSESAGEPTNDDFPVRENEPDEAVRVHGQDKGHGDRRSKSPTQPSRRRKKSQFHKRSRDKERSRDYEKGESRTVTIKDSDHEENLSVIAGWQPFHASLVRPARATQPLTQCLYWMHPANKSS